MGSCESAENVRRVEGLSIAKVNHPNFRTGELVPPPIQPYFARLSAKSPLKELKTFAYIYRLLTVSFALGGRQRRSKQNIYNDLAAAYEKVKHVAFEAKYAGNVPIDIAFNSLRPDSPAAEMLAFADKYELKVYRGDVTGLELSYRIYEDLIRAVYTSPEHLKLIAPMQLSAITVSCEDYYLGPPPPYLGPPPPYEET
ncbi:Hypothetical protein POVN_LOCUS251 [uncultured virus]|nr:Hypothetical protein POVN_LOCUS251 [uncultured virus]